MIISIPNSEFGYAFSVEDTEFGVVESELIADVVKLVASE